MLNRGSMAFINYLASMLLAAGTSMFFIAIYLIKLARKQDVQSLAVPAFAIGVFDFLSGFMMSTEWPLPGSYNILFGDPMLFLGLIMLSGAYMTYKKIDIKPVSILGFFLGIYILIEAVAIVTLGLEQGLTHLLPALGMYIFSGVAALFSPLVYTKSKNAYYFIAILLIIASIATFFTGYSAVYMHLSAYMNSPPFS